MNAKRMNVKKDELKMSMVIHQAGNCAGRPESTA